AVEETERPGDDRRLQHLLDRDLRAQVRLVVLRAVGVVLHRDPGERLTTEAEGVHVAVGGEGEEARRGVTAGEQRMAEPRDAAAAAVLQLLGAEDEDDVVHAGGDREAGVAEGVRAGRTVVLDARDRPPVEPERIRQRGGRLPPARSREVRAEVAGLDLRRVDARVVVGRERGVAAQLLVAAVVALTELGAPDPDDGDPVLHAARSLDQAGQPTPPRQRLAAAGARSSSSFSRSSRRCEASSAAWRARRPVRTSSASARSIVTIRSPASISICAGRKWVRPSRICAATACVTVSISSTGMRSPPGVATSCCAITYRSVPASCCRTSLFSDSPKTSTMRSIAIAAVPLWRVDMTRCPVSPAVSASRMVSAARISPTRMMSGLARSAARRPDAKPLACAPISR